MSTATSIEWTSATWNPVTGCTKVSPGCKHCYAETIADRLWATQYEPTGGTGHPPTDEVRARRFTDVWTHSDRLEEPLRWRKPRRVFVNSMSDLFHQDVPEDFIFAVFQTMGAAFWHTYQILTKRPERMLDVLPRISERLHKEGRAPLGPSWKPVWLGVSVEDQETADERIPLLLQTPAAVRFISAEPLLALADLATHLRGELHWVIAGGESGAGARPCDLAWIRSIVEQCKAASTPCFVKQRGSLWYDSDRREGMRGSCAVPAAADWRWVTQRDRKGGDPSEWSQGAWPREFPA